MAFLTEPAPERGVAVTVAPGVRRIVAANPGAMTYHGTNTYLIDGPDGVCVVDPGPLDARHLADILRAAGSVSGILITHGHHDHVAGLAALRAETGAPVLAFAAELSPDRLLADGDAAAGWRAIHTPGHAPDHLCFARGDGVVLSGDHVMGWSTSLVAPPDGSMADYFASLRKMLGRDDRLYLPGHGPAITQPADFVQFLLAHRLQREAAVLEALHAGPATVARLVDTIYVGLADSLRPAAERSVLAHLVKLKADGLAGRAGGAWVIHPPSCVPEASA